MQLHYQNTIENYFKNRRKTLAQRRIIEKSGSGNPSFVDLKIIEFWSRFMRNYPDGNCKLFCEMYMTDKWIVDFADKVYRVRERAKFSRHLTIEIEKQSYDTKGLLIEFHKSRNIVFARRFISIISNFFENDACVRQILSQTVENCVSDWLAKGCNADDVSLLRAFELKRLFHLSDEAMEVVLYLWLRDHHNMFFKIETQSDSSIFFDSYDRGTFKRTAQITGLDSATLHELCSKESALVKFQLVHMEETYRNSDLRIKRRELYLANEVSDYLYGFSDLSRIMDFKPAAKPSVSYAQIAKTNPKAPFILEMLKSRKKGMPLNILFYGREGTGKTELAKAIAQELDVSLLSVGLGDESMNEESLLQTRLRSMLLADWECGQSGGIILMDEADLVLNKAEKGLLNIFFETLNTPVIWITNNISMIENSTRRRFDYSLEFLTFSNSERIAIWQSVLRTQQAESMMPEDDVKCIAKEIPIMAGSATLAVRMAQRMQSSEISSSKVVREVASSHAKLLGISTFPHESRQEKYNEGCVRITSEGCNIDALIPMLKNFDLQWKSAKGAGCRENLNMLLYGPPGTGKSAFAKHVAHDILCREIVVKRASDILGSFVGENERHVREIFREAEQTDAILFIDEADSFFENRSNAKNHWEVTLVNEFICQMDAFNGMLIAATNYENVLDWSIRRRFQLKLAFGYMNQTQISRSWSLFFGSQCPKDILYRDNVTISDFQNVRRKLKYVPDELKTSEMIMQNMLEELANKDTHQGRRLGFA